MKEQLSLIVEGFEPFDLLRLSKDAFYEVVNQEFPNIEILDMDLSFELVNSNVAIKAVITDYKKEN